MSWSERNYAYAYTTIIYSRTNRTAMWSHIHSSSTLLSRNLSHWANISFCMSVSGDRLRASQSIFDNASSPFKVWQISQSAGRVLCYSDQIVGVVQVLSTKECCRANTTGWHSDLSMRWIGDVWEKMSNQVVTRLKVVLRWNLITGMMNIPSVGSYLLAQLLYY